MAVDPGTLLQHLISGLTVGSIYAATALGLTLVYGLLKILHIAHAGIYVIGAYAAYLAYSVTGSIVATIAAALLAPAAAGVVLARLLYMPMLGKPRHIPLMLSIAAFLLMEELIANIFGHHPKGFHIEGFPTEPVELGIVTVRPSSLVVVPVTVGLTLALWAAFQRSKIGIASYAVAQDMETAKALGVNLPLIVYANFAIGSILAGLAALLYGIHYGSISPYMGDVVAYKALVVIVLGGFGSIMGALAGGLILGVAEELLTSYLGNILPREAYAFIVLIALLIIRPQGLFGRPEQG